MKEKRFSIISILSFIFGCLGVLLEQYISRVSWILAMFFPLLAIIFGFIGLNQINKNKKLFGGVFVLFGILLGFFEIFFLLMTHLFIGIKSFFEY